MAGSLPSQRNAMVPALVDAVTVPNRHSRWRPPKLNRVIKMPLGM